MWCTISASKSRAYVSARRITCALVTLLSPSVKATAPAAFNRPISVISRPARPFVSAAIGWMLTIAVSRARRITKSTVAELSMTGEVSGWQMMVVMPPAAAAWLAEAKVSRWLAPGSPTKARMSISPGRHDLAGAIDDVRAFGHAGGADAALGVADHAVGDQHVAGAVEIARRIDDAGVGKQDGAAVGQHDLTRLAGCGRALPAPPSAPPLPFLPVPGSATARRRRRCELISTPRFIGPGCITSASGLA